MDSSPQSERPFKQEPPIQSGDITVCPLPGGEDTPDTVRNVFSTFGRLKLACVSLSVVHSTSQFIAQDASAQCIVGSPPYLLNPQIIGAEDDYFDSQQEQVNFMQNKIQTAGKNLFVIYFHF